MSLYLLPEGHTRWASFENPTTQKGGAAYENHGAKGHAFDQILPGDSVTLLDYHEGPGKITRMWMTIDDRSPFMLRSLVIRCYWDGAESPAVEAPLGDFFSCGSDLCPFENDLFSSPEGKSFNSFVPMPFQKSVKITIHNESDRPLTHLFYEVDLLAFDEPEKDALYFHCYWNRIKETTLGEDYVVLPALKGIGRILGTAFVMNASPRYGNQWWGEGEIKVYIDGDSSLPTLCSTGTEDYIGTGWGQGVFSHRYQGCTLSDWEARRWAFYRLHIADPIWFYQDVKCTMQIIGGAPAVDVKTLMENGVPLIPITCDDSGRTGFHCLYKAGKPFPEDGWVNYYRSDDMASITWFYLDNKEQQHPTLLPQAARI